MHRATWDPSRGKNNQAHLSRSVAPQQLPAHTVLKVRQDEQGGIIDRTNVIRGRRDLKADLERAEREARNKKRIAQGLPPEEEPRKAVEGDANAEEDEEAAKRRKLIEEAIRLDAEEDSDEEEEEEKQPEEGHSKQNGDVKGKGKASNDSDASDSSDSDSDDDEEDDTAALLRELEKIKRERQQEKERQERETAAMAQSEREDEIALGNPLLNLENAIRNQNGGGGGGGVGGADAQPSFGVKRRWDDDVIFKNQAAGVEKRDRSSFVNDLTRTEFHKKFLYRYLK